MSTVPHSLRAFLDRYADDVACRSALSSWRWGDGFRCPVCGSERAWQRSSGLMECASCGRLTSATAGTILHRSHLPLPTWFAAAYLVTRGRGINAVSLGEQLGIANDETSWLLLRRFRAAMGAALTGQLGGHVEADETLVGGSVAGVRGRATAGTRKSLVLVLGERGVGRCRMRVVPDARADTLEPVIRTMVSLGATITTDGHRGYQRLPRLGYTWDRRPHPPGGMRHDSPHATPLVDGLIAAMKDWLRATYRKPPSLLQPYLDEFCFRREFEFKEALVSLLTAPHPGRS